MIDDYALKTVVVYVTPTTHECHRSLFHGKDVSVTAFCATGNVATNICEIGTEKVKQSSFNQIRPRKTRIAG